MNGPSYRCRTLVLLALWLLTGTLKAQWAVIDVNAIAQLAKQVDDMEQAVATAKGQLQQAQRELQTMTGARGMQNLLSGVSRNYLPGSWTELTATAQGGFTGYPGLAASVATLVKSNAVLSDQELAQLSAGTQRQVIAVRQRIALGEAASQAAFADASSRFAGLQSLVAAIGAASDQKAILELQARITAELGMLQNEQNKLQLLARTLDAEAAAQAEQRQEGVIAGHGNFASRFMPSPR